MDLSLFFTLANLMKILLATLCALLFSIRPGQSDMFTYAHLLMLVAGGSCLLMIVAENLFYPIQGPVLVFIVAGIGLLGVTIVMAGGLHFDALYTALALWITAAVSVAIATDLIIEGSVITLLAYGAMRFASYADGLGSEKEDNSSATD